MQPVPREISAAAARIVDPNNSSSRENLAMNLKGNVLPYPLSNPFQVSQIREHSRRSFHGLARYCKLHTSSSASGEHALEQRACALGVLVDRRKDPGSFESIWRHQNPAIMCP